MDKTQSNVFVAEHELRGLLSVRGMRIGRAIRRLWPTLSDDAVQSAAAAWNGAEFGVTVGDDPALWASAYSDVRSCMHGKGDLLARAYGRHGVQVAVLTRDGSIVARCLLRDGLAPLGSRGPAVYGPAHHQLEAVLRIAGVEFRADWLGPVEPDVSTPAPVERLDDLVERQYTRIDDVTEQHLAALRRAEMREPRPGAPAIRRLEYWRSESWWPGCPKYVVSYESVHVVPQQRLPGAGRFRPFVDGYNQF